MQKKNNRAIILSLLFYITSIITISLNQFFIRKQNAALNEINFYSIFLITTLFSLVIINHYFFMTIKKQQININGIINIAIKIILYYLIIILIVNKFVLNALSIILLIIIFILAVVDVFLLIINFNKVNILISNDDEEIFLQEKEFKIKVIEKSEDFKFFQLNIFLFLIAFFSIYLVDVFIDYKNDLHLIIYGTVLLFSLMISVKYISNIAKISNAVKLYHYISSTITIIAVSLILYLDANLLVFLVVIPLFPIIKLDIDIRKVLLNQVK